MARCQFLPLLLVLSAACPSNAQGVFFEKVRVRQPSAFDWEHAVGGLTRATDDDDRLANYAPTKQLYDLFGPRKAPPRPLPLILYISPGKTPRWDFFEWTCRRQGVLFAAARGVGNGQHPAIRCRATLDVLADVRRRYRVDPDRTYVAGYSGGATIANKLAMAMPECFGGLMCMGQRVMLRAGPEGLARAADRLSVLALCGGNELVGPEVEHVDVPVARALGFRAGSMVSRHLGHVRPPVNTIEAGYQWLERGLAKRRQFAENNPLTRIDWKRPFDHAAWAQLILDAVEAQRTDDPQRARALARWMEERWPESDLTQRAAELIASTDVDTAILEGELEHAEELKRQVSQALLEGYEQAAHDRRASLTAERRAAFANVALRALEAADPQPADYEPRVASLQKVIQKAD